MIRQPDREARHRPACSRTRGRGRRPPGIRRQPTPAGRHHPHRPRIGWRGRQVVLHNRPPAPARRRQLARRGRGTRTRPDGCRQQRCRPVPHRPVDRPRSGLCPRLAHDGAEPRRAHGTSDRQPAGPHTRILATRRAAPADDSTGSRWRPSQPGPLTRLRSHPPRSPKLPAPWLFPRCPRHRRMGHPRSPDTAAPSTPRDSTPAGERHLRLHGCGHSPMSDDPGRVAHLLLCASSS